MYIEPRVNSSYRQHNLGKILYDTVLKYRPKKIIEFGVLHGYSTISMAQAVRDLGNGKITSYDLWDDYPFNHTRQQETQRSLEQHGLSNFATLDKADFATWLENPEPFDLMHLDISNNGDILLASTDALQQFLDAGSILLFEGGTPERDNIDWMIRYQKKPIHPLKKRLGYEILDARFPGISIINRKKSP